MTRRGTRSALSLILMFLSVLSVLAGMKQIRDCGLDPFKLCPLHSPGANLANQPLGFGLNKEVGVLGKPVDYAVQQIEDLGLSVVVSLQEGPPCIDRNRPETGLVEPTSLSLGPLTHETLIVRGGQVLGARILIDREAKDPYVLSRCPLA